MTSRDLTSKLGGVVMAWTVLTTTFLWTPTMRGLFRPDISSWSVMGFEGSGRGDSFWLFPALAAGALLVFYLYGRNRLRTLLHALLMAWHGLLVFIVVAGILQEGGGGLFQGAMWGVSVSLIALAVPLVGFLALTVIWITRERRSKRAPDVRSWGAVDLRALAFGLLLLPVAIVLFRIGEGIDWPTRLATAASIVQWILFTEALSNPEPRKRNARTSVSA